MKVETSCRGIKYAFQEQANQAVQILCNEGLYIKRYETAICGGANMCYSLRFLAIFPRRLLASRLISADKSYASELTQIILSVFIDFHVVPVELVLTSA